MGRWSGRYGDGSEFRFGLNAVGDMSPIVEVAAEQHVAEDFRMVGERPVCAEAGGFDCFWIEGSKWVYGMFAVWLTYIQTVPGPQVSRKGAGGGAWFPDWFQEWEILEYGGVEVSRNLESKLWWFSPKKEPRTGVGAGF